MSITPHLGYLRSLALTAMCLACWGTIPLAAQEPGDPQKTPTVSADVIRSRLQSIEGDANLEEAVKARLLEIYRQILTDLEAAKSLQDSRSQWQDKTNSIPQQLPEFDRQLETWSSEVATPEAEDLTQELLDKRVSDLQLELSSAQSKLNSLKTEPKRRADRRLEAPELIAGLLKRQAELQQKQSELSKRSDLPAAQRDAEKLALAVQLANLQLEIEQIREELAHYDASDELLSKQIELAEKSAEKVADQAQAWAAEAEKRRRESAARDIEEKETKAGEVPRELQSLANENLQLAETLQGVVAKIEEANRELATTQQQAAQWGEQVTRVRSLIDFQSGVTESVGNLLREHRKELPDAAKLRHRSGQRREVLYDMRSEEFATSEKLAGFADFESRVEQELRDLSRRVGAGRVEEFAPEVRSLLEAREKTLQELQRTYKTYIDKLVTLNIQQESLLVLVTQYEQYIDEHVLWIRSIPPATLSDVLAVPDSLQWLAEPESWTELLTAMRQQLRRRPWRHLAAGLVLIACFAYRSRGVRQIQRLGEASKAKGCRDFAITIKAFLWTVVVSSAGPALLSWLAWLLSDVAQDQGTELASPLSAAARISAIAYWPFSFWLTTVRPKGLAEAHFQWSPNIISLARRNLRWYVPTTVAFVAVYCLFGNSQNPLWERSLARFSLLAILVCATVFLALAFSPKRGAPREYLSLHRDGWLDRLKFVWYAMILAVPVTFAVQSLLGYQYTAQRLTFYLFLSVVFLSTMYMVEAILSRWLLINRRRLAIAQARERLLTGAPAPSERERSDLQGGVTENAQLDLSHVNAQTQRLLNSVVIAASALGLFFIWVEALPALARMHDVRLWRYVETTPAPAPSDGAGVAAAPAPPANPATVSVSPAMLEFASRPESSEGWVTMGHLLRSLLILILTYIGVRNIPGMLEITVLQHLPLDASIRFAITTVTRYAMIITGLGWAFTTIGFGWSKIQWLAAAVSVGLGFGLQEIFANFVSGLILLFERPLRAGDIVTVGNVTGTVVQIRTRATTIRDWDYKELVVPNKEFITGQLLNWTLTDETNRLVINIGVAYGSDIKRARDVILALAAAHPLVRNDPKPTVTFDLFGDSALNLTLRCVLARMEDRLPVLNDLHESIYDELTAAGFTIPFPQRDVHLYLESNGHEASPHSLFRSSMVEP